MAKASKGPGRPKIRTHNPTKAAARSTKEGEEKYIVILKTDSIEKMKDLAYWERLSIKDAYEQAIIDRVGKYEKKNGPLKSRPKE